MKVSGELTVSRWDIYKRRWTGLWREYARNRIGVIGLTLLVFFSLMAVVGPFVAPYAPTMSSAEILQPPSVLHLLGTNEVGQDILSQLLYGAQPSLIVGFAAGCNFSCCGQSGWLDGGLLRRIRRRPVNAVYRRISSPPRTTFDGRVGGYTWTNPLQHRYSNGVSGLDGNRTAREVTNSFSETVSIR